MMYQNEEINTQKIYDEQRFQEKKCSEDFVQMYLGLVKNIASKIFYSGNIPSCIDYDDLVSWGVEGLIKAQNSFDPKLKTKFQTYAYYRIKGEILDSLRSEWKYKLPQGYVDQKKKVKDAVSDFISDSFSNKETVNNIDASHLIESASIVYYLSHEMNLSVSESKGMKNPETEIIDEKNDHIWDEINGLNYLEKDILELFYVHGLKQVDIAEHLQVSPSKVSRIHAQVLEKLKNRLLRYEAYNE